MLCQSKVEKILCTNKQQVADNVIEEHPHLDCDRGISVRVPVDPIDDSHAAAPKAGTGSGSDHAPDRIFLESGRAEAVRVLSAIPRARSPKRINAACQFDETDRAKLRDEQPPSPSKQFAERQHDAASDRVNQIRLIAVGNDAVCVAHALARIGYVDDFKLETEMPGPVLV